VKVTAKNIAAGRQQLRSDGPLCDGIVQQGISFIDLRLLQNSFCNKPTGGTPHPAHAKPNGRTAPTLHTAEPNGRTAPHLAHRRAEWTNSPHLAHRRAEWTNSLNLCHPERSRGICGAPFGSPEFSGSNPNTRTELSSRPERSVAEGSAVRPSVLPNFPYQTPTPKQNCHPKPPPPRLIKFSPCLSMTLAHSHPKSLNGREPRSPSP